MELGCGIGLVIDRTDLAFFEGMGGGRASHLVPSSRTRNNDLLELGSIVAWLSLCGLP